MGELKHAFFISDEQSEAVMFELITLQGLHLTWTPLRINRSHASIEVLSPCCGVTLDTPMQPSTHRYTCQRCFTPLQIPTNTFVIRNAGPTWSMGADKATLAEIIDAYAGPLEADLLLSEVEDLLVETMNRASAEYDWAPEGNFRGPDPLSLDRQLSICRTIVDRYRHDAVERDVALS